MIFGSRMMCINLGLFGVGLLILVMATLCYSQQTYLGCWLRSGRRANFWEQNETASSLPLSCQIGLIDS